MHKHSDTRSVYVLSWLQIDNPDHWTTTTRSAGRSPWGNIQDGGEMEKKSKGSGGECFRRETDMEWLHLKKPREWFWRLLPKLPFIDCFHLKWDWKKGERGCKVQNYLGLITALPLHDNWRGKNEGRVEELALQVCYRTKPQGRKTKILEVPESSTGSLAEANKRYFKRKRRGVKSVTANDESSLATSGTMSQTLRPVRAV